jgi:hypothetical protein
MKLETSALEKRKLHIIVDVIEYVPNSIATKTIITKPTGCVIILTFDSGQGW